MYKRKKLKNKKYRYGGSASGRTGFEGSPELGGQGTRTSQTYGGGGGDDNNQTSIAKKISKVNPSTDTVSSSVVGLIGKTVFDISGAGALYTGAKKVGSKIQQLATPKIDKQTAKAKLSGSPIYDYRMKGPKGPMTNTGGNGDDQPLKKILKKPLELNTPKQTFSAQKFFPFRAFKSGGVPSGPPPLKGPNSQVPPVKMRNGKMTKTYKFSCPSRPDGIRGMGAAIKGHKFIGVK